MKLLLSLSICLLMAFASFSQLVNQTDYDIKDPGRDGNKCRRILTAFSQLPEEVRLNPVIRNDSIYIAMNSKFWFQKLIEDKNDGIAIDIVQQSQFACNATLRPASFAHTGYLLKPIYRNDLYHSIIEFPNSVIIVNMGAIPAQLTNAPIEANYLLLQDKYLCRNGVTVNLDFHGWQLLENGLYYDTLTRENLKERFKDVSKTLNFVIPFEKDKGEYNQDDIRPLKDSLKITDYSIKEISIKAFTSVEGDYGRNLRLQKTRAESIIAALQSYQNEKIESTVSTQENWVDFLNDIQFSPYKDLALLSKDEVKEKLKSKILQEKLEPILKNHRKGIVEIKLEKRLTLREDNPVELRNYFLQMIEQKNLEEALYLQQVIFYKIRKRQLPETFLTELDVPQSIVSGSLLINNGAFLYDNGTTDVYEAIQTFESLKVILPNNAKIDYNLCALKLQAWLLSPLLEQNETLRKEIEALRVKKIPDLLVRRLLINYHIILSEIHFRNQNFAAKDKALLFIYQTYLPLKLKDPDLVNLAKYFSHYSKYEWATRILQPRVKAIDVSEDLVFYYLNLTIYKPSNTKSLAYRTTMLNAVNGNRDRFCHLFDAMIDGGISFQLLEDPILKKTFCENCQQYDVTEQN